MFGRRDRGYRNNSEVVISSAPTGAAGGVLGGTYPDPTLAPGGLADIAGITRAQGDLIVGGASAWQRLAKGNPYQRLRMNAAGTDQEWGSAYVVTGTAGPPTSGTWVVGDQAMGLYGLWVCTAGGTPGTWTPIGEHPISDQTMVGGGTVSFGSIPQVYTSLVLRHLSRSGRGSIFDQLVVRLNGDTGANYNQQGLQGRAATTTSSEGIGATSITIASATPASTGLANHYGAGEAKFLFYREGRKQVVMSREQSHYDLITNTGFVRVMGGIWNNTAAVTSIDVLSGNSAGLYGRFILYGIG